MQIIMYFFGIKENFFSQLKEKILVGLNLFP